MRENKVQEKSNNRKRRVQKVSHQRNQGNKKMKKETDAQEPVGVGEENCTL